jgi:DNA replication protein DnaC
MPINLVLIGDTGLGKSHIAAAICYEAVLRGYPTACITAFGLVSRIHKAYNPASKINFYAKVKALWIDEIGYIYHKKEDTDILFQIISKRNEILPTIVTTNLAPKEWGSIFSATAASPILDHLSFNGRFITFKGRSYRLVKKHKTR